MLPAILCLLLALTLPFDEHAPALGQSWMRQASVGSSWKTSDGSLAFTVPLRGRAHIQRAADTDLITFSGKVSNWAAIYLVWGNGLWCGVGEISPTPFGRLYSTVVVNGAEKKVNHRGVNFGTPRWVRIRLGKNYIRFAFSSDGAEWHTLRTIKRPSEFAGAPKFLAAGKPYEAADRPFAPAVAPRAPSGGPVKGRILELKVQRTPSSQLTLSQAEIEALGKPPVDPVMAVLSGNDNDPNYAEIAGFHPAMKFPREIVGVPFHPLDIGVDWLGRLDVSPWKPPVAWFEVGDPAKPIGVKGVPFKRRLLHGYLPIDTLTVTRQGVEYELTVFGWSQDFRVDRPLFAYVQVEMRSAGGHLPDRIALVGQKGMRHTWPLHAHGAGPVRFCLRFEFPKPESAAVITPSEFQTKLDATAAHWNSLIAPETRFDVPSERVMEAYRAWLVYSMLNTDTVNGYLEPHDGAGFYEQMFGYSVALYTMACDQYGLSKYAAEILKTQMHFQQPNGLYTQACGLTDPGSFLVALVEHYRMTGDKEWLKKVSPHIIKQCEWIIRQLQKAPKSGVERGLIKFRPYNDYPDPVYDYLGNVWCALGLKDAAEALKALGMPEAARYEREAEDYRKDILDSMDAAAFQRDGQTLLPMEPDTHRLFKLNNDQGGDYYGLIASPLLATGFLTPQDYQAKWLVSAIENRGGLIAGLSEFHGGIDHAYTYGYLLNALKQGQVRKTLLGFWSMLAFGMTRRTYSPVEVTMIKTGENQFTLPHLYSCTQQLRLLRTLLLREDGDVLQLGEGIPRAWLRPGKHVAVTAVPTEFGKVSYRIDAGKDGDLRIAVTPPSRRAPKEIRLHLRDPQHRKISAVRSVPEVHVGYSGETVVLYNLDTPVDLDVDF